MRPFDRAWRGGRNNWWLHLQSVFTVAVAFVCLGSAALVVVNVDGVRARWANSGRASVFLKAGVSRQRATSIEKALRETEGVSDVRYVSSEAARKEVVGGVSDEVIEGLPLEAFPAL